MKGCTGQNYAKIFREGSPPTIEGSRDSINLYKLKVKVSIGFKLSESVAMNDQPIKNVTRCIYPPLRRPEIVRENISLERVNWKKYCLFEGNTIHRVAPIG